MTPATRAALAAYLAAHGTDGPPPGPGLWVVQGLFADPATPSVVDVDYGSWCELEGRNAPSVLSDETCGELDQYVTRHAPLPPEPARVDVLAALEQHGDGWGGEVAP